MRLAALAAIFATLAAAQAVRLDPNPVLTTAGNTPPGAYAPVLAIPGARIKLCTAADCTVAVMTFTDAGAGPQCPTTAQVTLGDSPACSPFADSQGNFGFWVLPGQYWYQITLPNGSIYGPFPVTAGTSSFGSGVRTFNTRTGDVLPLSGDYSSLQILGVANVARFSATPTFDLSLGTIQTITLTDTVTGAFVVSVSSNMMYEFLICQDLIGNHSFTWPGIVHGGMSVGQVGNKCSLQVFLSARGQLYAVTPGVTNQ